MSLPVPSIVNRTRNWFRLWKRGPQSPSIHPDGKAGSFSNARDITISGGQFIDAANVKEMKMYYINNVISTREVVFELLEPYSCLDATKDSSARHPPPKCHPETRLKIRERLTQWLFNEYDGWKMLWVRGSAGTGKSAVAQSFGDSCGKEKRHGASYFFSRTAGRDKLETVVPTIAYQLATTIPEYRSLLGRQLANNPLLLRKSPPVQFRELIVEPFAILQGQRPREPIVIILDGLDECKEENAQREILDMITDAIRTNPGLPLRWLIFSRPEAHLKNAFSRNLLCGRDELIIDAECRENVERYVRDRLVEIKAAYNDVTPADWPSQNQLLELLDAISGLFVLAETCLSFIDDPGEADPHAQLDSLLAFMRRSQCVLYRNPLAALDLLYFRILEHIPPVVFETTRRILGYMCHGIMFDYGLASAQALCNFLRLDQHAFYKAARGLHSVMSIPEPEGAAESQLQLHHASFQDFLLNPNRSGKFVISERRALEDIILLVLYWYDIDLRLFHNHDVWDYDMMHDHGSLQGLTWASEDNQLQLSRSITIFLELGVLDPRHHIRLDGASKDIVFQLSHVDFRYWYPWNILSLVILCQLDPSTSVVRIQPSSPTDDLLLKYFNLMIGNGIAKPTTFPFTKKPPDYPRVHEYFFIGQGVKSVIVWKMYSPTTRTDHAYSLRCDEEPSEAQISKYNQHLERNHGSESRGGNKISMVRCYEGRSC